MDLIQATYKLMNLHDQNLPVSKEKRHARLESVAKIKKLLRTMVRTKPQLPLQISQLDPNDPEWQDGMIYPVIEYNKFTWLYSVYGFSQFFYYYNYA